jgi:hypothetical protein
MAEYLDAKADLFRMLPGDAVAVLNHDDPAHEVLASCTRAQVLTFGLNAGADVRGEIVRLDSRGAELFVRTPTGSGSIQTALLGRHNLSNLLAAVGASLACGADLDPVLDALSEVEVLPGACSAPPSCLPRWSTTPTTRSARERSRAPADRPRPRDVVSAAAGSLPRQAAGDGAAEAPTSSRRSTTHARESHDDRRRDHVRHPLRDGSTSKRTAGDQDRARGGAPATRC